MKEHPAKKHDKDHEDPRFDAKEFGDLVHLDPLFLTTGKNGMIEIADERSSPIASFQGRGYWRH